MLPHASTRRPPMRSLVLLLLPALVSCAPRSLATSDADGAPTLAIVGASVLPMDGPGERVLENQTVFVRGARILQVGPAGRMRVPPGTRRVEGRGKWLMPGLVDMHIHMNRPTEGGERDLPLYLANGVTTVRNMRGTPDHLALRARVQSGAIPGPTTYTAGEYVDRYPETVPVERIVFEQKADGYDIIKIHDQRYPRARYEALARSARAHGMPLVGHVPRAAGLETAVREGHQTLEHAEDLMQVFFDMRLDTTRFPALVSTLRGSRTCVVPTLVVFNYVVRHADEFPRLAGLMARPELRFVRPSLRGRWGPDANSYVARMRQRAADVPTIAARNREQFEFMRAMTGALHRGGIAVAAGSDAGIPFTLPGYSLVEELHFLHGAGLTRRQALRAATRTAAECMGKADEFGAVAPGLRADLLLLDRDPRADLSAVADPAGVMVRGRWLPRAELRAMLEAVASAN